MLFLSVISVVFVWHLRQFQSRASVGLALSSVIFFPVWLLPFPQGSGHMNTIPHYMTSATFRKRRFATITNPLSASIANKIVTSEGGSGRV